MDSSYLLSIDFSSIPVFSFAGMTVKARILEVYDGDTITAGFLFMNMPVKIKLRMFGYDSPEIKPLRGIPNRDLCIKCAHKARDTVIELTNGKIVTISFMGEGITDKYGRQIGKVYLENGLCVNDFMVQNKLGKPYDGGKKSEFTQSDLYSIIELYKI